MAGDDVLSIHDALESLLRPSGDSYAFGLRRFFGFRLEVRDVHFHHDSAVFLPYLEPEAGEKGEGAGSKSTALAALAACFRHAGEHPGQQAMIAGHADTKGSVEYNEKLTKRRGKSVYHVLMGGEDHRKAWVEIAGTSKTNRVYDYKHILKWVSRDWGWACDPGTVNNTEDDAARKGVKGFQSGYNQVFGGNLTVDGVVGPKTWGAIFDVYQQELMELCGADSEENMAACRAKLSFLDETPTVGCSEHFPIEAAWQDEYDSETNRRVEVLFFDVPAEVPSLPCDYGRSKCEHEICVVHVPFFYEYDPIPIKPGIPKKDRINVHLKLVFKDGDGTDRPFPKDLKVTVRLGDGTTQDEKVGQDGALDFMADRQKQSFTLAIANPAKTYLAMTAPDASGVATTRTAAEGEVEDLVKKKHRVLLLPEKFTLETADWTVTPAGTYSNYAFRDLAKVEGDAIGTTASRTVVKLDPHWLHVRLEFFDRYYGHDGHSDIRIAIPPVLLEGYRKGPAQGASATPETRAAWICFESQIALTCQAVPWILRRAEGGAALPPLANDMLLTFGKPNTWVYSASEKDREIQVLDPSADKAKLAPSANRLRYYDLPALWKSTRYYTRFPGGTGKLFGTLTPGEIAAAEDPSKALTFSLDDIVMTVGDPSAGTISLHRIDATDRVAVMFHRFTNKDGPAGADLSVSGVYKNDSSANQSYFSKVDVLDGRYLPDYADWTRLVFAQGNAFEVFDRRTGENADTAVGARAAVRWEDSATLTGPANLVPQKDKVVFFAQQPFFQQEHHDWPKGPASSDPTTIGRSDTMFLRCCDRLTAGDVEVGAVLTYLRFNFDFNSSLTPEFNDHYRAWAPSTQQAKNEWGEKAANGVAKRWTGEDIPYNQKEATILPADVSIRTPEFRARWFVQVLPAARSHYKIGVFEDTSGKPGATIRAYMKGDTGVLDKSDNVAESSGWYTVAHESGHGASLNDEYVEPTTPGDVTPRLKGPWLPGFDSYTPGSPYVSDHASMMNGNVEVRARHIWHLAQWVRDLLNIDFVVNHFQGKYSLPRHTSAPKRAHVTWPLARAINCRIGTRGYCDLFFYPLGKDDFPVKVIWDWVSKFKKSDAKGNPFDAILVALVKMKVHSHHASKPDTHTMLQDIDERIELKFQFRFAARGMVDGKNYGNCLLYFAPRYYCAGYSPKVPKDASEHFEVTTLASGSSKWDSPTSRKMEFSVSGGAAAFQPFFGEMLGIQQGNTGGLDFIDIAGSYVDLAAKVIANAHVNLI